MSEGLSRYGPNTPCSTEREQRAVQKIAKLKAEGLKILEIVRYLNEHGYETRSGRLWFRRDIERILANMGQS
ncbi:MAG: recombinase family protein [Planctomycetota bacterium]|jgi:hypothetical protein